MMSTALLRGGLFALSALLGGWGIFYLYYSFVYPPVGAYAFTFLARRPRSPGSAMDRPEEARPAAAITRLWLLPPVLIVAGFIPVTPLTLFLVLMLALDALVGVLIARDLAIELPAQRTNAGRY